MTEQSPHIGPNDSDPADRGAQIGTGLVPDEVTEGEAEAAAHGQPREETAVPGDGEE